MGRETMSNTSLDTQEAKPVKNSPLSVIFKAKELGIFAALVILTVFFSVSTPVFLTLDNIMNVVRQVSILGILAVGMTMVIVSGEIDLSVGSLYGVSVVTMSILMTHGVPIWVSILAALAVGTTAGIVNGLLVTMLRVPALIVTLGMLNMARGTAMIINGGMVVPLIPRLIKDPALDTFIFIGRGKLFDTVPTMTIGFVIVLVLGFIIYQKNIIGYRMRAVGGNAEAARVSGINVKLVKIVAFTILGFLAAFGGTINSAFLGNVQSTAGQGLELDVIAATILGGASLSGGEGTIVGTLIGVLLLGILRNGLVLLGVSPFVQMVLIGAVLIGAVALDMWSRRK
jgi:ribose/xylose/arabinose/galactoside ABC-type transport system permease subunit